MSVITLTKETYDSEVLKSDKPVLIDFFATWCNPCRMVAPVIDEIAKENGDIKVCKVDVDKEPELAQSFGVASIPTLVAIRDGKVVNKAVGVRPKAQILSMVK